MIHAIERKIKQFSDTCYEDVEKFYAINRNHVRFYCFLFLFG